MVKKNQLDPNTLRDSLESSRVNLFDNIDTFNKVVFVCPYEVTYLSSGPTFQPGRHTYSVNPPYLSQGFGGFYNQTRGVYYPLPETAKPKLSIFRRIYNFFCFVEK